MTREATLDRRRRLHIEHQFQWQREGADPLVAAIQAPDQANSNDVLPLEASADAAHGHNMAVMTGHPSVRPATRALDRLSA